MQNPYEILGIDKNSSESDIKKSYFNLIKRFTPEKHGDEFKKIRGAYDQLKDSKKRIETDMFIFSELYEEFVIDESGCSRNQSNVIASCEERSKLKQSRAEPEKYDFSARIKIDHVFNSMVRMFSDLGKMDFSDDFNTIQ
ncbi:J domain-containing protein [bacterium]|nr:J domain-containing protein [bacterium]